MITGLSWKANLSARIGATFHRLGDALWSLVLGRSMAAAITCQPGSDIRELLGHDGRPAPGPARIPAAAGMLIRLSAPRGLRRSHELRRRSLH